MARTKIPIFLAAAVAGGLALGMPGAAAAQSVGFTVLPSGDGVYPPRPIKVENVVDPGVRPVVQNNEQTEPQTVCEGNNCNNNGWFWPQQNWQGWNWPQAYTTNDTKTGNAQPIVAPGGAGAGGPGGVMPVQNAVQSAQGAPEGAAEEAEPTEEESEEVPEEETTEDETSEEEAPPGMGPEENMGGGGPAPEAAGPAGGGQLPFTGAPAGVAAVGAGLLAVALGCTLVSARRRRSSGAE
ncbi:hypothetical protein [Microbispora siamensis]|uniref:Gram-positive cocci surface proteins LPxTG domain-containing protein n=1 Tax=Microbispora siamensis TaxID=564413 RepID=A0ABQ4GS89_9ACTN|nr:hypothetical protein [Microbispora siamensis]GIH64229.1 hypothetical protein Msi02_50460 [Microbispora siamensis]